MNCPQCGTPNNDGFKFCMKCGASLPQVLQCEQCGTDNPQGFQFCMQCGQALGSARAAESNRTAAPPPPPPQPQKAPAQPPPPSPAPSVTPQAAPAAAPPAPPPAAPPQPQVVIIKDEDRRRTPAFLWILLGMLMVVMMCVGLLWLGIVKPPGDLVASLPDPLPEIVDAISHQQIPDLGDLARVGPGGDQTEADSTIVIHNNSGQMLGQTVIVTCAGRNQVNVGVLIDGEVLSQSVPTGCYDLQTSTLNGDVYAAEFDIDVDGTYHWYIKPNGGDQPARPGDDEAAESTIVIHNNSNATVFIAYFSRCSTPASWEQAASGVPIGGTSTFSVLTGCYDLKAVTVGLSTMDEEFDVYVDGTYHWYIDPPEEPSVDVCGEDLENIIASSPEHTFTFGGNFSANVTARFTFYGPLNLDEYDLYVEQYGVTSGPFSGAAEAIDDSQYQINITEPFQYLSGPLTFRFTPKGQGCVLGEQQTVRACASSEDYHHDFPYNGGCCTRGCWCQQAGEWGCWQTCDPLCAE